MAAQPALPSLLWSVLSGLEQAYTLEGAGRNGMPSLDLWSNLLRVIPAQGTNVREMPARVRLSKRAVRTRIAAGIRGGWIEPFESGRGEATLQLTLRGADAASRWKSLQTAAEEKWCARVGMEPVRELREALKNIVAVLPLEHPHYPASYGAADASITGGNGQDWKAVPRGQQDTVSDLPLSALVSQAIVAFAMDYEELSPVAHSLSTSVIKRIPPEGRPLRGLGDPIGVSALVRHGFVYATGKRGHETVQLTQKGAVVGEAFDQNIQAVEIRWRNRFGDKPVAALRRALEAVAETAGAFSPVQ
jgi:hypothetical protein